MITCLLIVVAVVAAIVKRAVGEPIDLRELAVPPLALLGVGVHGLLEVDLGAVDVLWLVVGSLVGLAMGVLRGSSVRPATRDGVPWQRRTARTFARWGLSAAVDLAVDHAASHYTDARPITLPIGVGLLGEAVPVGLRANALTATSG